jgi:hypothetical protein
MKDEEIKELASKYANSAKASSTHITEKAFIAGAHSRDEEISELNARIVKLMCERDSAKSEMEYIIEQSRNQWISVKDRLPEDNQYVFIKFGKDNITHLSAVFLKVKNDDEDGLFCPIELCGSLITWKRDHAIENVTHWMPIPKVKEEETKVNYHSDVGKLMYYTEPFNWIVAKAIMEGKIDGYIETKCGFKANIVAFRCVSLPNPLVVVISNAEQTVLVYPLDGKHGRYDDSYDLRLVLTHHINECLLNTGVKI